MPSPTRKVLDLVWARDESRCFVCTRHLHRGRGGYSVHHRVPRGMGGSARSVLNQPPNLLLLCGSGTDGCHGWVEHNRDRGLTLGLLVSKFNTTSLELQPVKRWGAHWVVLTADGGIGVSG